MSELNLNVTLGPRYQVNALDTSQPFTINVGAGTGTVPVASKTVNVVITAQEVVNAYRAIGYDGLFSQLTYESLSNYAGVTRVATVIGESVAVVRVGLMEEPTWTWTANAPIFISANGVLTQALPAGFVRRIGWAISPTTINLDPFPIITGV